MSRDDRSGTSAAMESPGIFDRAARRLHRDRAFTSYGDARFLRDYMIEGIADRLAGIAREFRDVLDLGCFDAAFVPPTGSRVARLDPGYRFAAAAQGVQGDEDRLPFADHAFDLVVAAGTLDTIDDLPGALTLARRVLRPDGLFLAAFVGAGSLATLRGALRDAEGDRPGARIHPQVDVRAAGDLLMRAGFALPVADTETLTIRYASLFGLLRDLRGMAGSNVMQGRSPLRRDVLARAADLFADRADPDGRTTERLEIVFMTGWSPAPSQPKPARRGSATQSLANALRPPTPSD
ncbi:MAG: SAM-dependent methyltransferase [Sphingomonas sp. 28-62-20]|nr:MAG: SAM-dependent methyltransferase [Sphingomonas sp. 28-62-20]